jgi:hypothetical protein
MKSFKFELGQRVVIAVSGEQGTIQGRAEYMGSENQYQVRYKAGDGRAVEAWWEESALATV